MDRLPKELFKSEVGKYLTAQDEWNAARVSKDTLDLADVVTLQDGVLDPPGPYKHQKLTLLCKNADEWPSGVEEWFDKVRYIHIHIKRLVELSVYLMPRIVSLRVTEITAGGEDRFVEYILRLEYLRKNGFKRLRHATVYVNAPMKDLEHYDSEENVTAHFADGNTAWLQQKKLTLRYDGEIFKLPKYGGLAVRRKDGRKMIVLNNQVHVEGLLCPKCSK